MAFNISYLSLTRTHQPQIVQRLLIKHARKQLKRTCKIFREISKRNMCHPKCLGDSDLNAKLRDFCRKTIFPPNSFCRFPTMSAMSADTHVPYVFNFNITPYSSMPQIQLPVCLALCLSICPKIICAFLGGHANWQMENILAVSQRCKKYALLNTES